MKGMYSICISLIFCYKSHQIRSKATFFCFCNHYCNHRGRKENSLYMRKVRSPCAALTVTTVFPSFSEYITSDFLALKEQSLG